MPHLQACLHAAQSSMRGPPTPVHSCLADTFRHTPATACGIAAVQSAMQRLDCQTQALLPWGRLRLLRKSCACVDAMGACNDSSTLCVSSSPEHYHLHIAL